MDFFKQGKPKEISHSTVKLALDIFNFEMPGSENGALIGAPYLSWEK